jgi:cation:H+ antiporter
VFAAFDLEVVLALLSLAALVILVTGLRMTGVADTLAERTGLGGALIGGVLLGAATSLSGTVVSVSAALDGRASLAFSNGIGGIAAQTAFLALADLLHRRANIEHAAAELANIFQCATLVMLLSLVLVACTGPDLAVWSIHPVSAVLVGAYLAGVYGSKAVRDAPMWRPIRTEETELDEAEDMVSSPVSTSALGVQFAVLMLMMGVAGWLVAQSAGALSDRLGIAASTMGALLTAVVTSLPELVTTLAAVRRGALQLAVGGIIGGNTFDVLFLSASDTAFRDGSLYHAVAPADLFWLGTGMVMVAVLMMGMILRQKHGPAGIGLESVVMLTIYLGAIVIQTGAG